MDYHWRIQGGAAGARPPTQQDQFLLFLHTFSPKSVRVGGWCPPNGKSWIRHWLYILIILKTEDYTAQPIDIAVKI